MDVKGWFGLPLFGRSPRPEVVSCTLSGGGSRAGFQLGALDYLYRHDEAFAPSVFVGASVSATYTPTPERLRTPPGRASGPTWSG